MPKFVRPAIKRLRSTASFEESAGKAEEKVQVPSLSLEATPEVSSSDDVFNKFKDLDYFLELVEVEQTDIASTEQEIRWEGWRRIQEKGIERCCDWSNQSCDRLEQMWEACVSQAEELNLAALSATSSGVRSGMKREMYEYIYRFLRKGEYPVNIADDSHKVCQFRYKCAKYAINSDDQIEYRNRGAKRIVLLEGEVEPVVRYVHSALGHASYVVVKKVVNSHFHTSCTLRELAKVLVGGCTADCERLTSETTFKSVRIRFRRTPNLHIEGILGNETLFQSDIKCVLNTSGNVARVGMPVSKYQRICASLTSVDDLHNDRKDYKLDKQKGLLTRSGNIVLDDRIGADVIFQIHNKYGHITAKHLKDLVSLHFYCLGAADFAWGIRSFCSLCGLRSGTIHDATPPEVYRNADYEVLVDWKDGERKISILPIGLDLTLVECYVERILKKNNATMEHITRKQDPENVNSQILPIHRKILSLSSQMSNLNNRCFRPSVDFAVPKKSALKRRRKEDGLNTDARSVHWGPIYEKKSSCDIPQMDLSFKDTTDVVQRYDDTDCFSDDDSPVVPNLNWTKDFERSYAEFAVPQSEGYEAPIQMCNSIYDEAVPASDSDANSLVKSDKLNQVSEGVSEECGTPNTPEDDFIELQPVIGCPQYMSPSGFMSFEEFYLLPYNIEYPVMSPDPCPLPLEDSSRSSLGETNWDELLATPESLY